MSKAEIKKIVSTPSFIKTEKITFGEEEISLTAENTPSPSTRKRTHSEEELDSFENKLTKIDTNIRYSFDVAKMFGEDQDSLAENIDNLAVTLASRSTSPNRSNSR